MNIAQMNEILGVLGIDIVLEDDLDNDIDDEIPDFPDHSEEEIRIPDAFVPDNIETL